MTLVDASSHWHVPVFSLNDRLSKARSDADITQERMGQLLGCSRRTIVRYEQTGVRVPRSVLLAYHVATQTDLAWLETGKAPTAFAVGADECTPRDLNPEPTDYEVGPLAPVVSITSLRPRPAIGIGA